MILSLLCASLMLPQQGAMVDGVTLWVWRLKGALPTFPTLVENQTPNLYSIVPTIDFQDGFASDEGPIREAFLGEARGFLRAEADGPVELQLNADDGGRIFIDDRLVLDVERDAKPPEKFVAATTVSLRKGANKLRVQFYQDGGKFVARLRWRKPGAANWTIVPASALQTEAGQTFVTSPGIKTFRLGGQPKTPGDQSPLEAVHPAYTLENFRGERFKPAVGGLCFIPDGRLAVCTWDPDGAVYLIDLKKSPVEVKKFASGLGEPLGILWYQGHLLVTQKGEVTRLVDSNNDGVADRYEVVASGWPVSHNYHEFTFNLVPQNGKLYVTTSVPLRGGWTNYMPGSTGAYAVSNGPGRWIEIDPRTGQWKALAHGLRTPNGMGIGVDGRMYVCDNQGSWMPSSRLNVLRPGAFYGHQETPDGKEVMDPPVVWFPQGEIGNSPSQPVLVKEGMFRGQMLVGDVTYGGIQRVFVERVKGVYQGTVFRFSQGIEAGVNRMVWGPDGCLYVGGIGSNGNWNHNNDRFGLQRLRYNGKSTFEMFKVETRPGGLLVTFSQPASPESLVKAEIDQFHYEQAENYGGDKKGREFLTPRAIRWSKGNKAMFLELPQVKRGHIVHIRLVGLKSAKGEPMWSTESWTTVNETP
ncbi:MAG: DUF7133 domain-containing protein [Fimbriimonas sp.]